MSSSPTSVPGGAPMIARISQLKGLGVFSDYALPAEIPDLRKYNLIYGFNGSGKTTLSRVLASLGAGALRPQLPTDGTFTIQLVGGATIKSSDGLVALKDKLLVFNIDFIEDNIKWTEGKANPVFYIGREQVELAEKLDKTEKELASLAANQEACRQKLLKAEKAFGDFKSQTAKTIAEQTGVKSYTAATLAGEYAKKTFSPADEIPSDDVQPLLGAVAQAAPLPKRAPIDARPLGLTTLVSQCRRLLDTTLGELAVAELREHSNMVRWVKEGVEYHGAQKLKSCLFCGKDLTPERMEALRAALDNRLDRLNQELAQAKAAAVMLRDRITTLAVLPSKNDVSPDLQGEFSATRDDVAAVLAQSRATVASMIELLELKLASPNTRIDSTPLLTDGAAAELGKAVVTRSGDLNAIIARHNTGVDKFGEGKEAGRVRIRAHNLARSQNSYRKLEGDARLAKAAVDEASGKQTSLAQEVETLRQGVRAHGPAAERINALLHSYLGHKELEIKTLTTGYEIQRNGRAVTSTLSEGEKTAIALCYFLATLEAEGRRMRDLIVVVDDPISSLDTRALHHAFGLIKSSLGDAGQLIVMTHNVHFMNAVKKWLMTRARPKAGTAPTATFFFLDASQHGTSGLRAAEIKELPKHIREYDSEYHYLFHLVLKFLDGTDTGHTYLMPNALRKVLDIFLAFKLPGTSGLGDKVDQITKEHGLDPARMMALDRLVQLESHADSLDDVITFSSMTVEESKRAAEVLIEMMKKADARHLEQMTSHCGG